jgi:hypothetical protein
MSSQIVFIWTNQIQDGALEKVKEEARKSTEFFGSGRISGGQLE